MQSELYKKTIHYILKGADLIRLDDVVFGLKPYLSINFKLVTICLWDSTMRRMKTSRNHEHHNIHQKNLKFSDISEKSGRIKSAPFK